MAEQLGQAELLLTVNLDALKKGLRDARQLVENSLGDAVEVRAPRQNQSERSAARRERQEQRQVLREQLQQQRQIDRGARQGGARENTRALEIAREKRFRLLQRINLLEERGADVSRLRNSREYGIGRLTEAQSRRQFGSFRQISQELARKITLQERSFELQQRDERAQRRLAAQGARQGGASESIFARENAQDRRFKISQRINRLEDRGVNVDRLRTRLGELSTAQAESQFGSARQLSRELDRQVKLTEARYRREQDIQRTSERQRREILRSAAQTAQPISGRTAAGAIPGSPAFRQQQLDEGLRLGRLNAQPVTGRTPTGPIPGSPADREAQRRAQQRAEQERARAQRAALAEQRRQQREEQQRQQAAAREQRRQQAEAARQDRARRLEESRAAREQQQQRLQALREQRVRDAEQRQTDRTSQQQERARVQAERRQQQDQQRQERLRRAEEARAAREAKAARDAELRQQRQQDAEARRIGRLNASPISGRLPGGVLIPGSPAFREREQREQQKADRRRIEEGRRQQERDYRDALRRDGQKQGEADRQAARQRREEEARQTRAAREEERRQYRAQREDQLRQIRAQREQDRQDAAARKEKAKQQRARQAGGADPRFAGLGDAIIGGAFPLLFGQGLGSSIGGAAGGFIGGRFGDKFGGNLGFGLSLAGTALGSVIDNAVSKLKTLGEAFSDPIASFDALREAALLSSTAVEKQVAANIAAGRDALAAIQIQQDLIYNFGSADEAQRLVSSQKELQRSWSALGITISSLIAGPLSGLNKFFARLIPREPTAGGGVDPNAPQNRNGVEFDDFKRAVSQIERDFGRTAAQDVVQERLRQAGNNPFSNDVEANKKALEYAIKRGFVTQELLQLYRDIARLAKEEQEAIANSTRLRSANYKLIDAQAQGNKDAEFAAREQLIREERLKKLQEARLQKAPTQVYRDIESDTALKLYELTVQRGQYEKQLFADRIAASNRLLDIEGQIAIANERATGRLTGAGVGALQAAAGLEAAKRREQDAQAQLRVRPSDTGLQNAAREAAKQTQLAAASARADLIEAANAAKITIDSIQKSIQDSVAALKNLRLDNLQFLTPDRQKQEIQQLNRDVQATAVARGERITFRGTEEQIMAAKRQYVEFDRQERGISNDIRQGEQNLAKANADLYQIQKELNKVNGQIVEANKTLSTNIENLAKKDWTVNVNVPGGSASGDVVSAVNSRS